MRAGAADLIGFTQGHEALARHAAANDLHGGDPTGFVLDDAVFAITAAQKVGAVDPILVFARRGDEVIRFS
jgi:hypothetical protein